MLNQNLPVISQQVYLDLHFLLTNLFKMKILFERERIPGFVRVLLAFIDEIVINHWYGHHEKDCCESPRFGRNGLVSDVIAVENS